MEILENKIKKFLSLDFGNGSGYDYGAGFGSGDGSVYGHGYGAGFGSGNGSDYGSGHGYGDGNGYVFDNGSGYGYGDGNGHGFDNGSGYGYGDGNSFIIKEINSMRVYKIDAIQTIITHVLKNIAKGFILTDDLTLKKCYIVKGQNMFAHGETLEKAREDLQNKIFSNLDVEGRIKEFKDKFKDNKKYKGTEFYKWHNLLTGSCEMGRNEFVRNHNINLEDEFSVKEFIELTKNGYGSEIIKQLTEFYK